MESHVEQVKGRRYRSLDGSERYLVDAALLEKLTEKLGGDWAEPLNTTVVHQFKYSL